MCLLLLAGGAVQLLALIDNVHVLCTYSWIAGYAATFVAYDE
jgi:hypothetical protein